MAVKRQQMMCKSACRYVTYKQPPTAPPPKYIGGYVDRGPSNLGSLPIGAAEIVAARIKVRDNLKWEKCPSHI